MTRDDMLGILKTKVVPSRFDHSIGAEYTAGMLAAVHGCDIMQARIAGLLHDNAKCIEPEKKIKKALKFGLTVSDYEKKNPNMLHAKLGAYYAKYRYEVEDQAIIDAIECHTTGKPNMTLLDKIIFIADYIEPNRKIIYELDDIRREAFTDIDKCLVHILKNTIEYLDPDTNEIDTMTLETYNYYVNK